MRGKERGLALAILGPLILTADLVLLLWGKVVLDVEGLADLLGRLALDHVRNGLAANVEKSFDVKVIGSQYDLKEHFLVNLHVLHIPLLDVGGLLAGIRVVIVGSGWVLLVVLAPFHDLLQHGLVDIRNRNGFVGGFGWEIVKQVLDEDGALSDLAGVLQVDAIRRGEHDLLLGGC